MEPGTLRLESVKTLKYGGHNLKRKVQAGFSEYMGFKIRLASGEPLKRCKKEVTTMKTSCKQLGVFVGEFLQIRVAHMHNARFVRIWENPTLNCIVWGTAVRLGLTTTQQRARRQLSQD